MDDTAQRCARCGRQAPPQDSDEFTTWEAFGEEGTEVICEECITPEEHQEKYEDMVLTGLEADELPDADGR
jgi:recombinational DNA repair protein (RecF pathway)